MKKATVAKLVEDFAHQIRIKSAPYEKLAELLVEERAANSDLREQIANEKLKNKKALELSLENEERFKSYIFRLEMELKAKAQEKRTMDDLVNRLMKEIEMQKLEITKLRNAGVESNQFCFPDTESNKVPSSIFAPTHELGINDGHKIFDKLSEENRSLKEEVKSLEKSMKRYKKYISKAVATIKIYEQLLSDAGLDF